jgi:hypothetical protein
MSIPLSAVRAPAGELVVTAHLHGMAQPVSIVIDLAAVDDLLAEVEQTLELKTSGRRDPWVHMRLRDVARRALVMLAQRKGETERRDRAAKGTMGSLLWLALNHYERADEMRSAVASAVRRGGNACITIQSDGRRVWGFAVSDQFVDMEKAMKLVPRSNKPTSFAIGPKNAKDEHLH